MTPLSAEKAFGSAGFRIPPLIFSAAPLANACAVRAEQTRVAICVEWLKSSRPAAVEFSDRYDTAAARRILGQVLHRIESGPDGLLICPRWSVAATLGDATAFGDGNREFEPRLAPTLLAVDGLDEILNSAATPSERQSRLGDCQRAFDRLATWRNAGRDRQIGIGVQDHRAILELLATVPADWVAMARGPTPLRHPPELFACLHELARRRIPVVGSSVFHGGFLAGS